MNLEEIKLHWQEVAKHFPPEGAITPTSRDPFLGELERDNILRHLRPEYASLELGCGDGLHTVHYAKVVRQLSGLDLTASLIDRARQRAASEKASNIDFTVGSVLDLKDLYRGRQFDCIITQRCLINLPEWSCQRDALAQAHALLRPGGILLLTEGFQDEADNLNAVRARFGLPAIACNYNRSFGGEEFREFVRPLFEVVEQRDYGAYLFLSRLYHPLAVLPTLPMHDSRLNEVAALIGRVVTIPDLARFSYNLFFALKKKS